jgi:hypothetical protein
MKPCVQSRFVERSMQINPLWKCRKLNLWTIPGLWYLKLLVLSNPEVDGEGTPPEAGA